MNDILSLLGKSENDEQVKQLLSKLGIQLPLDRLPRGEDQANYEIENQPLELCFVSADSLYPDDDSFKEGELVLKTVFVEHRGDVQGDDPLLPFGLRLDLSRSAARKAFGSPAWSSPVMNNDRWIFDGVKTLVCFNDDESGVRQIAFSPNA
ncbi:hypothetical protein [Chitinolyticbacter albus]|uniref:hypothetical protein n=1 Tax=Chitinolyticbacter albus TaxID=2961951 RepID=UPI00210E7D1D|nr:hypothetical protein [Chitinolyticbacter albus]